MPYETRWQFDHRELVLKSYRPVAAMNEAWEVLLKHAKDAALLFDISGLVLHTNDPPPPPQSAGALFTYHITRNDGRVFNQTIEYQTWDDQDPSVTFDVPVGWRFSEFNILIPLRLAMVKMTNKFRMYDLNLSIIP